MSDIQASIGDEEMVSEKKRRLDIRGLQSRSTEARRAQMIIWAGIIVIALVTLLPLYWMLRVSLTHPPAIFQDPRSVLPPLWSIGNYMRVLGMVSAEEAVALGGTGRALGFFQALRNSLIVTALITVAQVFFSACAAYAFARLHFPFRDGLFSLYVGALMIPQIVIVIPNFALVHGLGWLNTFAGIVAPYFFMTPLAVFFMRQFFVSVNKELEESAYLDGAGRLTAAFRIVFPISTPALLTAAIIVSTTTWNEYLWMLVVGRDRAVRVLTVALGIFRQQTPQGAPDWGGLMAGTMLAVVPIGVLFLLLGKHVVNAIGHTGFR